VAYPAFPAVQTIAVAAILHIPWRAHGQSHAFLIEFEDADGQKVGGRLEGRFEAQSPADAAGRRLQHRALGRPGRRVSSSLEQGITRPCLRSTGPR